MQRRIIVTLALVAFTVSGMTGCKKKEETAEAPPATQAPAVAPAETTPPPTTAPATAGGATGEELYKQHCAACHPDGGNTMKPEKTLSAKGMAERSKITTVDDVVKAMRNPGPGMPKFDEAKLPEEDARKIAEYTLATFP